MPFRMDTKQIWSGKQLMQYDKQRKHKRLTSKARRAEEVPLTLTGNCRR